MGHHGTTLHVFLANDTLQPHPSRSFQSPLPACRSGAPTGLHWKPGAVKGSVTVLVSWGYLVVSLWLIVVNSG